MYPDQLEQRKDSTTTMVQYERRRSKEVDLIGRYRMYENQKEDLGETGNKLKNIRRVFHRGKGVKN
jgi:hypothetical protein